MIRGAVSVLSLPTVFLGLLVCVVSLGVRSSPSDESLSRVLGKRLFSESGELFRGRKRLKLRAMAI